MQEAYEPPTDTGGRPFVITWFRIYAATALAIYAVLFLATLAIGLGQSGIASFAVSWVGSMLAFLTLGAVCGLGVFVPYKPWGWTVALVAICLGLPTILIVFSIPLLLGWMKPETKAAFGRL